MTTHENLPKPLPGQIWEYVGDMPTWVTSKNGQHQKKVTPSTLVFLISANRTEHFGGTLTAWFITFILDDNLYKESYLGLTTWFRTFKRVK